MTPTGGLDLARSTRPTPRGRWCCGSTARRNPTGALDDLGAAAAWGRAHGVPVFSDECYVEFTWDGPGRTILEHGLDGVVAVHSLSKRSNLAGVRVGFYAGDAELVHYLQEVRKHVGMLVPGPGPGRRRRRPRRRRPRRRPARALPPPARADGRDPRRLVRAADRRCRPAASTCGSRSTTAGRSPSGSPPRAARSSAPATSTAPAPDHVRVAVVQPDDRIELVADAAGGVMAHAASERRGVATVLGVVRRCSVGRRRRHRAAVVGSPASRYDDAVERPRAGAGRLRHDARRSTATGTFTFFVETKGEIGEIDGDCDADDRSYDVDDEDVPRVDADAASTTTATRSTSTASTARPTTAPDAVGDGVRTVDIDEPGDYELTATTPTTTDVADPRRPRPATDVDGAARRRHRCALVAGVVGRRAAARRSADAAAGPLTPVDAGRGRRPARRPRPAVGAAGRRPPRTRRRRRPYAPPSAVARTVRSPPAPAHAGAGRRSRRPPGGVGPSTAAAHRRAATDDRRRPERRVRAGASP